MRDDLLDVRVRSAWREAEDINAYELVRPDGGELPPFAAGAHIDVHSGDNRIRQYSLCNPPWERNRYLIGILRDKGGRGGSIAISDRMQPGTNVTISVPRNFFPLSPGARRHLLIAGGIGITPMMAMLAELERRGAEHVLHYCTRAPERTAFRSALMAAAANGRVHFHHDAGDPRNGFDVAALLREQPAGTHLYFCGPPGFMTTVRNASAHWPGAAVHCEYFTPPAAPIAAPDAADWTDCTFKVQVRSTGAVYDVPAGVSIVQVLRDHGMHVETSCESGLCGTCRTRYVAGEPEHNDYVLEDDEKKEFVLICCARSKSPLLVLDR